MNWKKIVITPVAIYAVIFLFISVLVGAKADTEASWVWVVSLIVTLVGLYLGTNYTKPKKISEGLLYGVIWVAILVILDLILTVPFTGWEYFSSFKAYLPYVLTILIPTLLPKIMPANHEQKDK